MHHTERFPFRNLYGENDAAMRGYTVREALDVSVRVRMYQYDTYEVAPGGAGTFFSRADIARMRQIWLSSPDQGGGI